MTKPPALVLFALTLTACGSDPWVGRYEGSTVTDTVDCATGDTIDSGVVEISTLRIERGDAGLFFAARCPWRIRELSDTFAEFRMMSCETSLDDGTPLTLEIVSGTLDLRDRHLLGQYTARATIASDPPVCGHTFLDVTRVD